MKKNFVQLFKKWKLKSKKNQLFRIILMYFKIFLIMIISNNKKINKLIYNNSKFKLMRFKRIKNK